MAYFSCPLAGFHGGVLGSPSHQLKRLDVVRAAVESDGGSQAVIRVVFSLESAKDLHRFSAMHVGRSTAVIVAEEVVATPFIAAPVADIMVIHGPFDRVRANEIAERIMN